MPGDKFNPLKNTQQTFYENAYVISSNREKTCFNWFTNYCGYYFLVKANSVAKENSSLFFNLMNNLKNSSLNKPFVSVENLEETLALFTRVDLNNLDYFVSNQWLDKKIAEINFDKLNEFNPAKRNFFNKNGKRLFLNYDAKEVFDKNIKEVDSQTSQVKSSLDTATISSSTGKPNVETITIATETFTSTTAKTIASNATDPSITIKEPQPVEIPQLIKEKSDTHSHLNKENLISNDEFQKSTLETLSIESIQTELNSLLSKTLDLSMQTIASTTTTSSSTSTASSSNTQTTTVNMPNVGKNQQITKDENLTSLNNRIKILEFNMSLSSQYLEKLSQHYR